jgi:hypothetical protein
MTAKNEWSVHQHDRMCASHSQNRDLPSKDWDQTGRVDCAREEDWKFILPFGNLIVQVRSCAYLLLFAELVKQILILGSLSHAASQLRVKY